MCAGAVEQVPRAWWFGQISLRPHFLCLNPCILRECANHRSTRGLLREDIPLSRGRRARTNEARYKLMWMAVGEDHSYLVFLCTSSRATHVSWFQFFIWITLPRHMLGILVMEESDGVHSHGVHGCTYSKQMPQKCFFAQHIIGNILVASRRLVMHTCEWHDEGMICFFMARDPSCACSPVPHTTLPIKIANCRATSEVRICCGVIPPTMRSIMFRRCSRRKHQVSRLNPSGGRTERTLNKDAVHRDGEWRKFEGRMVGSMFQSRIRTLKDISSVGWLPPHSNCMPY